MVEATAEDPVALFRAEFTPSSRALEADLTIDPGFVNHRLIETALGSQANVLHQAVATVPPFPEWLNRTRVGHVYSRVMLQFCRVNGVKTLGHVLAARRGRIFCSTEQLAPCPTIYNAPRVRTHVHPDGNNGIRVALEFSTSHVTSDTIRSRLQEGARLSIIAMLDHVEDGCLVFHPFVMGSPWLSVGDEAMSNRIVWFGYQYFENFVEDCGFRKF
jgi:hypothetical protein